MNKTKKIGLIMDGFTGRAKATMAEAGNRSELLGNGQITVRIK